MAILFGSFQVAVDQVVPKDRAFVHLGMLHTQVDFDYDGCFIVKSNHWTNWSLKRECLNAK